jgi:pilus assembly protein CpaB
MGPRRIVVLLLAVVFAGATAMYARSWIESQRAVVPVAAPAPKQVFHEVLVADVALPAGTLVKPRQVRWQKWPTDDVPRTYVLKSRRSQDDMIGAVVRRGIAAGDPITDGAVVKQGERGFLAAVLSPGMRAMSVPINLTSGNSGLILPGDRVDLILTQTLHNTQGEITRRVSETVITDLRVLAMGAATDDVNETQTHERAKTATLEVTPRQAEEVALLTELGKLSLSLRSLAQDESELVAATPLEGNSYTWDFDVSSVLSGDHRATSRLLVMRGGKTQDVQVQQGTN